MKTSSHTTLDAKGYVRIVTEYQLTPTEKAALCAIAKGLKGEVPLYDCKAGEVEFYDYTRSLYTVPKMQYRHCAALANAGLLCHTQHKRFYRALVITPLGKQMVATLFKGQS